MCWVLLILRSYYDVVVDVEFVVDVYYFDFAPPTIIMLVLLPIVF